MTSYRIALLPITVFCALALLLLAVPERAEASNFVYGTPGSHNARGGMADTIPTGSGGRLYRYTFESGRSYACTVVGGRSNRGFASGVQDPDGVTLSVDCGSVTPVIAVTTGDATGNSDNRLCLIAEKSGFYSFQVTTEHNADDEARHECLETSLYGGYNTNANEFNFLEVTNTTNTTLTFRVYAVNFDGTVVINNTEYSVGANRRVDISVHDSAGANVFGLIRVSHNGPYGALQAAVSQYKGPVSSLSLAASVPLRPRDQAM